MKNKPITTTPNTRKIIPEGYDAIPIKLNSNIRTFKPNESDMYFDDLIILDMRLILAFVD